jgi:hypothetical protein
MIGLPGDMTETPDSRQEPPADALALPVSA